MQVELKENYNIKNMTTFKIGGNVKQIFFPKNAEEFSFILKEYPDSIILGNCSNILFSSEGTDKTIISTTKMNNLFFDNGEVIADCGVKGPYLSLKAYEHSLSGLEFMIAFPGSVGGNIYMNAGAHNQMTSDNLVSAEIYDKSVNSIKIFTKNDLKFSYRKSVLQENTDYILLSAKFKLQYKDKKEIKTVMDNNLSTRKINQPILKYPNAGCIFKNPQNNSAGKLLDDVGAKNFDFKNVKVWHNHANFIVNKGNATSSDVLELMHLMYTKVNDKFGIELIPEIRYIGNKNKYEEEICKVLYKKNQK